MPRIALLSYSASMHRSLRTCAVTTKIDPTKGELTLILELGGSGELLSAAGRGVGGGGKGKGGRGGDGQRGNECGELHIFWILLIGFEILQEFLKL